VLTNLACARFAKTPAGMPLYGQAGSTEPSLPTRNYVPTRACLRLCVASCAAKALALMCEIRLLRRNVKRPEGEKDSEERPSLRPFHRFVGPLHDLEDPAGRHLPDATYDGRCAAESGAGLRMWD
jgi:hypothetical protein